MSNKVTKRGSFPMGSFFNDFFDNDSFFGRPMSKWWDTASPATNISETDKEYLMEIATPGFKKEDIKVDVENNIITISAEVEKETADEQKDYSRKEYNFSSFSNSFRLPDNVKDGAITAKYVDGVLKLTLPKSDTEVTANKKIEVN